jgi:mannosyltransferase
MTSLDPAAPIRSAAVEARPEDQARAPGRATQGPVVPLWMRILPPAVTLAVMLWGITTPSYSRDEAATLSAVQRSFPQLLRMLQYVDIFHGAYYVMMWPIVHLVGAGELATRLPSAVAMAVAAYAVAATGWRLISPRAGLAAGLVFAVLPYVSLYGQTARPYGLATALAAIASYILIRILQVTAAGGAITRWLLLYGVCMTALGYIHPFALLLLVAHAVPVAWHWMRDFRDRARIWMAQGWLAIGVISCLLLTPMVIISDKQSEHISLAWTKAPASDQFAGLTALIGPAPMVIGVGVLMVLAIAISARAGMARMRADWPADLLTLTIPWLILPATILITYSAVVTPMYTFRYVMFCTPAVALLVGAALAAIDWRAAIAAFVIIAALGFSLQIQMRSPAGHEDNIRAADRIVARYIRPGDEALYITNSEPIGAAYPYGIDQLQNVVAGKTAIESGTLGGKWAARLTVQQRLATSKRMWYIDLSPRRTQPREPTRLLKYGYTEVRAWHVAEIWLILYSHHPMAFPLTVPAGP